MTGDSTSPGPAPGWYRDPTGRRELRLWDGVRWTDRVDFRPPLDRARRPTSRAAAVLVLLLAALLGADVMARVGDSHREVQIVPAQSAVAELTPAPPTPVEDPLSPAPTTPSTTSAVMPVPAATVPPADRPRGPAFSGDFPDPSIVVVGSTYWAFATGGNGRNLSMMSSADLASWTDPVEALPILPSWATAGSTWAPAVLPVKQGFLLYYAARVAATGRQCISAGFSRNIAGPFLDISTAPMICQVRSGGSIDPSPFVAPDGTRYLLWKSEDNAVGAPSRIGVQKLGSDGLSIVGQGVGLLTANAPWQDGVIEGPAMAFIGGRYVLLYGANHWDSASAGIGVALCDAPMGPCVNQSTSGAWLGTAPGRLGPSGPSVFTDRDGALRLAYHAGHGSQARALWTLHLRETDGLPTSS